MYDSNFTVTVKTDTKGLFAYHQLDDNTPRYRLWNEYNFTGNERSDTNAVGGDITWVVTKANHERDEWIIGTEDKTNDIDIQIYNGATETWGNLQSVSTDIPNSGYRSFDIAYEHGSGDALIVFETGTGADQTVGYRIWNGTAYSVAGTLTTGMTASAANWISLVPKRNSDYIMLLVHNSEADGSGDLYAVQWNGTDFQTDKEQVLSATTTSSTEQHFAFAWQESSLEGLAAYGEGTDLVYRNYSDSDGWSGESTIPLGAESLDAVRMCSDRNSDYVGLIWQDSDNDVNASMWDGDQILSSSPSGDSETEQNGAFNANVDCAWHTSGDQALLN